MISLFIRSYPGDFEWLRYSIRSMRKNMTGVTEKVLVTPKCTLPLDISSFFDKVFQVKEAKHGYIAQQVDKIQAHKYVTNPYILYSDSDCIYYQPYDATQMIVDGKVNLYYTPYDTLDGNVLNWRDITYKIMGIKPTLEYMRCFPIMHLKEVSMEVDMSSKLHKYIAALQDNALSEFNCLGLQAHVYHSSQYNLINTLDEFPKMQAKQYWSWGGITDDIRKELETI